MGTYRRLLTLPDPDATADLAGRIGAILHPGDCLLLEGGIGAGKTHFARSLIQSLMDEPEDVPSPTFTLVQEYDTSAGPVWHADLYRLSRPEELIELGLDEALETAISVIEWPDRMGPDRPDTALTLAFDVAGDTARRVTITGDDALWRPRLKEAGIA
jgi:tRNA threonylcarbamoyladenosine biosynthesis protein TsaE